MPTVNDYLNAANSVEQQNGGNTPAPLRGGLTQFSAGSAPLTSAPSKASDGFYASVYQNSAGQLIVSFAGTSPNAAFGSYAGI